MIGFKKNKVKCDQGQWTKTVYNSVFGKLLA